jgi:hypothetical protein
MSRISAVLTVRSFERADDPQFLAALAIYNANTDPRVKTDAREISQWLENPKGMPGVEFFCCGLFDSSSVIGFTEFAYFPEEKFVHFDYFIIEEKRRTAGTFFLFVELMGAFLDKLKLDYDFVLADVAELGPSRKQSTETLVRLFRQVGFCEAKFDYKLPALGFGKADTEVSARLLIYPRVHTESISSERFYRFISAIWEKYHIGWYSLDTKSIGKYRVAVKKQLAGLKRKLLGGKPIALKGGVREFAEPLSNDHQPPLQGAATFAAKICASALVTVLIPYILHHSTNVPLLLFVPLGVFLFVLLVWIFARINKDQLEAFKIIVSLLLKFFDH